MQCDEIYSEGGPLASVSEFTTCINILNHSRLSWIEDPCKEASRLADMMWNLEPFTPSFRHYCPFQWNFFLSFPLRLNSECVGTPPVWEFLENLFHGQGNVNGDPRSQHQKKSVTIMSQVKPAAILKTQADRWEAHHGQLRGRLTVNAFLTSATTFSTILSATSRFWRRWSNRARCLRVVTNQFSENG